MTTVLATTDELPELEAALARRHESGLDTYDEWWEGVYRVVVGPTPEHGRIAGKLFGFLDRRCEILGLHVATPVNIGRDKWDAKVPDLGVYHPDTPRHSPAFLTTALLVVEILSPREPAGEKLPFYAAAGVAEYLEVDQIRQTLRLLVRDGDGWVPAMTSQVLGFTVAADGTLAGGDNRWVPPWVSAD